MWVSSKEAAEALGLNKKSLEKACFRANQASKKICSISGQYLPFEYTAGIGAGGKTLQIYIGETDELRTDANEEIGADDKGARDATKRDVSGISNANAKSEHTRGGAYASRKAGTFGEREKVEVIGYAKVHSVAAAAIYYDVSEKNIYRWQKEYRSGGVKALKDTRGVNNLKVDLEMVEHSIYAVGSAHTTTYFMAYCMFWCKKNKVAFDMFDLKADISFSSFYRAVERLKKDNADVRNYLRRGLDGLEVRPTAIRDYLSVNNEWQVDATKIDFMALNEMNEPQRYTAVAIVDVASRRRVWELFDSANSYANVRLLKKALLRLGVPEVIKGDNGKDYVSEHFQGVLRRIGVPYWAAEPFKGWQKGMVERNFGILQTKLEILPGYIGHNAGQRIEREAQAIEKAKRMSGVKTHLSGLLTKDELRTFIDEANERLFNKDFEAPGCDIDFRLFGQAKKVVLHATGVNFNRAKYVNLDIFGTCKINTKLEIIEDIDNYSKVYAYTMDGTFVCEMIDQRMVEWSAEEVKAAQRKHNKEYVAPKKVLVKQLQKTKDEDFKALGVVFNAKREAVYKKEKEELLKKPKDEEEVTIKSEVVAQRINSRHYTPPIEDALAAFD
jgi:transposase InsO family protein